MAFFGLFGSKSEASTLRRHAERTANKRAQAIDRWESIQALIAMGTPEAAEALLQRFTFYVEPGTTDQEEKDAAYYGIVALGERALDPVGAFLKKAGSISWPLKILDELAKPEIVVEKLLGLLREMDIEYERDPQRKVQVLAALQERVDARIVPAVVRFLEDTNETVRFNAVGAVFAQKDAEQVRDTLVDRLCAEESVRIRNRLFQGFAARDWDFGKRKEEVRKSLTANFTLDSKGIPRAKSSLGI
jgi:HEAT repeat protein